MLKSVFSATIAALLSVAITSGANAQTLRFGAGQQGSQNYGVNAALAQAIEQNTDLDVTVQSFGGPTAYIPMIDGGELDLAAVVTPDLGDAVRGNGPFEGMPQDNLRMVAALFPSPVGLMVRADSGIETIADLKGKRVAWGIPAQASLQPYVEGALANGGLKPDDVTPVPVASVANGVEALVSGTVDATLFALRGGKVVEADSAVGGIRWLAFDSSPVAVANMQEVAPEAYLVEISPDDNVIGIEAPVHTMAYDYVLMANSGVPDDTIASIATLLLENGAEIASSNKVLGAISEENVRRPYPGLPFHPAAEAVLHSE
jgi:uncharacterized protein